MHKTLILFIFMIAVYNSQIFAAKPITSVPAPPINYEVYTDNEDIYFEKYLEYYIPAIMLQTQLKMMGVKNFPQLPALSYQDLENMDVQKLKNIVNVANNLLKQVVSLPDTYNPSLIDCEKSKSQLEAQIFQLTLDTIALSKDKKFLETLRKKLQELITQSEKNEMMYLQNYQKLVQENFELKYLETLDKDPMNLFLLKLIAKGSQLFVNNSDIEKNVFPSISLNFEAVNIAQNRANVNLWSEYSYQFTKVKINPFVQSNDRQHYIEHVISFGADAGLNLAKLFNIKRIKWDFDLGYGYFIGFVNHANYNFPKTEYQGNIIKVETSFYNFWKLTPFGLHFGTYFNRFADDVVYFKDGPPTVIRSGWHPSIYMGISFNLIQVFK